MSALSAPLVLRRTNTPAAPRWQALVLDPLRADDDDHFYGAWSGGKKGEGGHPEGGGAEGEFATQAEAEKALAEGKGYVVSRDGLVHVYHGTTTANAEGIKQSGLKTPEAASPTWLMVTTSRAQAAAYAIGHEGDKAVVHFALSPEQAKTYLFRGRVHGGIDMPQIAVAHGLKRGLLPAELVSRSASHPTPDASSLDAALAADEGVTNE